MLQRKIWSVPLFCLWVTACGGGGGGDGGTFGGSSVDDTQAPRLELPPIDIAGTPRANSGPNSGVTMGALEAI